MASAPQRLAGLPAVALLAVALLPAPAAAGGAVAGKVDVSPVRFQDETVVYLKGAAPRRPPRTHEIDQKGMKFIPFVLAIQVGDTVEFLNTDSVEHEVYSGDKNGFNVGVFRYGERRTHVFDKPGVYEIRCSLHPMMQAWVFVGENPFAAAIDRQGRFRLEGVPAGTYQLAVWNAHLDVPERSVTVRDGGTVEQAITAKR